jgi:hypothetical protein
MCLFELIAIFIIINTTPNSTSLGVIIALIL